MFDSIQHMLVQDTSAFSIALGLEPATARIEVQCLLQKSLHVSRVYLFSHPEHILSNDELIRYDELKQRRLAGEPIAYILGEREFFGLNFKVNCATLIPRPDTELLVELAVQRIPSQQACTVLDLGTGSGAIALAIAHMCPLAAVLACDRSDAALEVARENAQSLHLFNVKFLPGSWFEPVAGQRFSFIVSNPPYIAENDPHLSLGDVRFEPVSALVSGEDGLDDIRHIISRSSAHLLPQGWLLLEHGFDQALRVRELLENAGFQSVFSGRDLAGIERVSGGRRAA